MSKHGFTTADIVKIERLEQSVNGNPRYALHTAQGDVYRTKTDSGCAYVVSVQPEVAGYRRRYRLTFDGRGSVIGIEEM